jgi:hypothetical protein
VQGVLSYCKAEAIIAGHLADQVQCQHAHVQSCQGAYMQALNMHTCRNSTCIRAACRTQKIDE